MSARPRLASLAWRNIWRNRRRTLITLFGITFGVLLAVLATGLGDASYEQMIDFAAKSGGGHVSVQHEDHLETPSPKKTVTSTASLRAAIAKHPGVEASVERVSGAAMLATAANSYGAGFMAIDPTAENQDTLPFLNMVASGEMLRSAKDEGIVVGAVLAENLDLELGKKVVVTLTDRNGEIVSSLARVRGIVETGSTSIDASLALVGLDRARTWLGYGEHESTQVAIFASDQRDAPAIATALSSELPNDAAALTWEQTSADLAGFIAMKSNSNWILQVFIMVLMAAGIFNTLFVGVMERLREFGIMSALGFSRRQLFAVVMWESLWIGVCGLLAAALFTGPLYYYLHTQGIDYSAILGEGAEVAGVALLEPVLYVDIYASHLLIICTLVMAATLASGLYPAWRAGRVPPADAIRLT